MTFDQVIEWGRKAAPGASLSYRKGRQLSNEQKQHNYSDAVWGARRLYNLGLVDLVQERLGKGSQSEFDYRMIRKAREEFPKPSFAKDTGAPRHLFHIPDRFLRKAA